MASKTAKRKFHKGQVVKDIDTGRFYQITGEVAPGGALMCSDGYWRAPHRLRSLTAKQCGRKRRA